jgi:hypothetical protein
LHEFFQVAVLGGLRTAIGDLAYAMGTVRVGDEGAVISFDFAGLKDVDNLLADPFLLRR